MGGTAYIAIQLSNAKKENTACSQSVDDLIEQQDYLNGILKESGLVEDFNSEDMTHNLKAVLASYDTLELDSKNMSDSMKAEIDSQRVKINGLLQEVETLKSQKKRNWGKIYKLQKETETLREIMKGYIYTIDSLNTVNIAQGHKIIEQDGQIKNITHKWNTSEKHKDSLQAQVAEGKILQSSGMSAIAIRIKSGGDQKETSRAKKANMVKACFTIMENRIADAGNKTVHMRVIGPNGKTVTNSSSTNFDMGGKEGKSSVKRDINYQNKNLDLCVYFEFEGEGTAEPGTYKVEIYIEGQRIGKTSFALK